MLALLVGAMSLPAATPALPRWHISANRLTIPAGRLAADITVANDDVVSERFEVKTYAWSQRGGVDRRSIDLDDVLVVPRLFSLAPGERKRVRVGVLDRDPNVEADYRVSIEQLVDPRRNLPGIHFLLAYDVPLFVAPARAAVDARIDGISARAKSAYVVVRNDGNEHLLARALTLRWRDDRATSRQLLYVLPHSAMRVAFALRGCGDGVAGVSAVSDPELAPVRAVLSVPCVAAPRGALERRTIVTLRVNRLPRGDAVIVARSNDLYVRARDVAGVPFRATAATRIGGELYESLRTGGVAYAYDARDGTLDLAYRAATLRRVTIPSRAPPLYENGSSASIAYSVDVERRLAPSLSEIATIALHDAQVHLGFAIDGRAFYRTGLAAVIDDRAQMQTLLAGDQALSVGNAMPALPIFGVGIARGVSSRTLAERAPYERVSGDLANPTTIRIEYAGAAPVEIGVEAGHVALDGVPRNAHVSAVDDVTHLPVELSVSPPLDAQLVAPGWREVDAGAGVPRVCIYECARYRGLAFGGSLFAGESPSFAGGPYAEFLDGRSGIGYDAVDSDPTHALAISAGIGSLGGALLVYEQRIGAIWLRAAYAANGAPAYDATGDLVSAGRSVALTFDASYRRLRASVRAQRGGASGDATTCELLDDVPVPRGSIRLDLADKMLRGAPARLSLTILVPTALGARESALLGTTIGPHDGRAAELAAAANTPSGLAVTADASGEVRAAYASDAISLGASSDGLLTLSGALVFLHGAHLVRETSGGYAIAVGDPGDLLVDGEGRVHEVRGTSGTAFPLPALDRPTSVTYVDRDDRLEGATTLSTDRLFPEPGAGAIVVVRHSRLRAVIGRVAGARWRGGTIALAGAGDSPIGSDGLFYFEELAAGTYAARITGASGSCAAVLVVPASKAAQIDVGAISCATGNHRRRRSRQRSAADRA